MSTPNVSGGTPPPDPRSRTVGRRVITKAPGLVSFPEGIPPNLTNARAAMEEIFGHPNFREDQPEVVEAALGTQDILSVMATSAGKSLTYQLPAVIRWLNGEGTTIVISPLISLMRDQTEKLRERGIQCAFFDSIQSKEEREIELDKVFSGEAALLYVAPERFVLSSFQHDVIGVGLDDELHVPMVVVDEAHVISQWGDDFRAAYGKKLRAAIDRLGAERGRPQIFATTATATAPIREDIITTLGLEDHFERSAEIDRPNITYVVEPFIGFKDKLDALYHRLRFGPIVDGSGRRQSSPPPSIVYVATRRKAEEVAEFLAEKGISSTFYHAGLEREDRIKVQEQFMHGITPVIVATTAFGMGIDKRDVRQVIHLDIPGSLEQYAQESGRAGRDGELALAELWYQAEDAWQQIYFINSSNPSRGFIKKTYQILWKFVDAAQKRAPQPTTYVNFENFLDEKDERFGYLAAARRAALVSLQQYGLIEIDGWRVRFLVKPRQAESKFPTEEEVREKRDRAKQQLKVMLYYASQGRGKDASLRRIILEHHEHNRVVEKIARQELREMIGIDPERIEAVVHAVACQDFEMSQLASFLRGSRAQTRVSSHRLRGELASLTQREVRSVIRHAAWLSYLRIHTRGRASFVSLTPQGLEMMHELLPEGEQEVLEPSTRFSDLRKRVGHAAERNTLRDALEPWYTQHSRGVKSDREWKRHLEFFFRTNFDVLDERVTGRELVALFAQRKSTDDVTTRDGRRLIHYLFPDPLTTAADRRKVRR